MTYNHGANLFDLSNQLGFKKTDILDFSSNINPFGSSMKAKEAIVNNIDMVSIYPDPKYKALKASISTYCNCKSENILLGGGATELISSFIDIINPKKALLLSPAYSEYEKELNKIGCTIVNYFSKKEDDFNINIDDFIKTINNEGCDLAIICNPNNPTGFAFSKKEIAYILENSKSFVMVDETYIEFTDKETFSSTSLVDIYSKLFVIRGTSKFFSTPGIRLGYGLISDKSVYNKISSKLDLWNINIFATIMGEIMFLDSNYINETLKKIQTEREYLLRELNSLSDLKVYDSKGNFILCEIKSKKLTAKELYENLLYKKIIIRNCSSFNGLNDYFFRVCVLKPYDNNLLIKHLKSLFT